MFGLTRSLTAALCFTASLAPSMAGANLFDWFSELSPKAQRAQNMLEGFDAIVDQALKDFNVPGMGIGVVVDGHVILAKGYGFRDVEKKLPNNADTLFAMGSATKAFTTFLMGMMVEDGLLHWDEPVADIIPEFRLWDQYATQNLTLRDLITHRSGMPRHDLVWYNSEMTREDLMKKLRYLEPTCDIRERYNYNNLMYMVAGTAMERIAGETWETLTTEKILKPLGMHQTNFSVEKMRNSDNAAFPYIEKKGKLRKMKYRDVSAVAPAGALNSTINEMTHWVQMLLARGVYAGNQLISPSTLSEIEAPQIIVSGYPENKEALLNAYGLGWGIVSYRGHYYVSHDGGIDGFTSVVSILPQNGVGLVVVSNKNLTGLSRYVTLELIDRVLELPLRDWLKEGLEQTQKTRKSEQEMVQNEDLLRKKGTFPSHELEEYAGTYEHPGYGSLKIEAVDGHLEATLHGITSTLEHWHYDVFSVVEESEDMLISREGTKYSFRNNIDGEIEELMVPYESSAPDIVFRKRPENQLMNLDYYRQFTGSYEIYGVVVEVAIRDRALVAIIPGQPIYELVPLVENEFIVKSMSHYSVRFVQSTDGIFDEALLVLPYGAFGAKRIR